VSGNRNVVQVAGNVAYAILFVLMFVLAFLFYGFSKIALLLYSGWIFLAFGACMLLLASQSRGKARECSTSENMVIESGLYAYVRHPEFFSQFFIAFALILLAQQGISVIVGVVLMALLAVAIFDEEKRNREKFGEAYERYTQRVPRINLIAGIIRKLQSKNSC